MAQLELDTLKAMVEAAAATTSDARSMSEQARDYYDGYQYTDEEVQELKRRKQPIITNNRIQRKIDAMVGIEQRGRTDPKALGRTPAHDEAADIATQALMFVDDETRFDVKRSQAFENLLVEGYGGAEIVVEQKRGRMEIVVNRLRWEEIFFDPASREKDFSDATFLGCMKWMSLDKAISLYGSEHEETLEATVNGDAQDGETYDDRPFRVNTFKWGDRKQRRVRISQMYYQRGGVWYLAIFTGGGEIRNDVSPYVDEDGTPVCPMVLMSAYVDRENRRYGLVRGMLSVQDEINKRRSKALHLLNSRQTMGAKGAVDVAKMKTELAKPDGHVDVDVDLAEAARAAGIPAFQVLPTNDMASGNLAMLAEAKAEIDLLGPNASLQGQAQGQQSGRAIMAQQNAGLSELAPIYDSLRDWTIRCYEQMWLRIKQYWNDERWVRVTDEAGATQFIGLNVPAAVDPFTGQVVQRKNDVARMDVDIIIEDAPDLVTLRQEEFQQLAEMAQRGIPIPPELLIEASSVRNKKRILDMMAERQQQAMQGQAQQAQIEGQKAQAEMQFKAIATQAKAQKDSADAVKTTVETQQMQRNAAVQELMARRAAMGY